MTRIRVYWSSFWGPLFMETPRSAEDLKRKYLAAAVPMLMRLRLADNRKNLDRFEPWLVLRGNHQNYITLVWLLP